MSLQFAFFSYTLRHPLVQTQTQAVGIAALFLVLQPVPRKSQHVIIILTSLLLGRGPRTGRMLFLEGGDIRHGDQGMSPPVRMGTVTVGYGSVDGWGLRSTYTHEDG